MTDVEKIAMVKLMCGETDDDVISAYLFKAGKVICKLAYPFAAVSTVPERYEMEQIDAAVYWLNKRGAEGELSHNENGVNITYENADLPASLLRTVVPMVGVV